MSVLGLAEALRASQVTLHLAPLVPRIVAMGGDGEQRRAVGRQLRRTADRLQGIYPWLAELIGDVSMMSGVELASGIRRTDPTGHGPFVDSALDGDGQVLRPAQSVSFLSADVNLASVLMSTIRPFTGVISPPVARALIDVVREQVGLESSLEAEAHWRTRIAALDGPVTAIPLIRREGDRWWHPGPPTDALRPSPSTHESLIVLWRRLVGEHAILLNRLTWENVRLTDGRWTITGRLAGSAPVRPITQRAIAGLVAASGGSPPELHRLLAHDLGADLDSLGPLVETVFSFVEPLGRDGVLGPRAALRALDSAPQRGRAPRVQRDTFLLIRQLALFRSMAVEAGRTGHLFRTP